LRRKSPLETSMLGLFNPASAVSSQLPSVGGGEEESGDKERDAEEEKLRQEAIKEAEEKRRIKHKKMEEDRENMRQGIRDKYQIEKKVDSDEEDEDDDEDFGGPKKKPGPDEDDPVAQKAAEVKELAERGLNAAKDKCKVQ